MEHILQPTLQPALKDKRVLVTGGSGVIGRELLNILSRAGAHVVSVDKNPHDGPLPDGVTDTRLNLTTQAIDELADFEPNIIFHLAASFERSKESPGFWKKNWDDNVLASHRIVDLARRLPSLAVFVFASSYLIYSPQLYLSRSLSHPNRIVYLTEDSQVEPRNITGAAKYYTEKELDFVNEYFVSPARTVNARIYRVYGCGSKDVISRWIRDSLSGKLIPLYNKENTFDFIYAGVVAEGLYRLALCEEAYGVVNLGSGQAHSVKEVAGEIASVLKVENGVGFNVEFEDLGTMDAIESSCADLSKLQSVTGWKPSMPLKDGIRLVMEYEKKSQRPDRTDL
ncbi:MAG: NAD(P)-dependent oxidoreductase [Nitrospirae bacterium]|nr:NAD(P)-dependent oxidoreductase [Nitrospirota bacterium]